MKIGAAFLSLIAACLMLFACGKRYVGQVVDTHHPAWHRVASLPDQGRISNVGPLAVDFQIERGESPFTYVVTGAFDASGGTAKSWAHVMPEKSKFSMLIASEGMVVDNISFMVRESDLSQPLPFRIDFFCDKPIEAIAFWYQFYMRG